MLDKDKLFLVFYLDISLIHQADIPVYVDEIARTFNYDESINRIIIPVRSESRVECINPSILDESKRKEVEEKLEQLLKEYEEAVKQLKNE